MKTIPRERLGRVEELYLSGHSVREIQATVATEFGVTRRAVRRYLRLVCDRLAAQARGADPNALRARVEGLLLNAYRAAEIGGAETGPNASAMVAAASRLAELHGVMAPKRHELGGPNGGPIPVAATVVEMPALDAKPTGAVAPEPGAAGTVPGVQR